MKLKFLSCIGLLVLGFSNHVMAQKPLFAWAKATQNANVNASNLPFAMSLDSQKNVIYAGEFNGLVDFDPGAGISSLTSIGGMNDLFVSKLDSNGNHLWSQKMVGMGIQSERIYSTAVDSDNNIYVAGVTHGDKFLFGSDSVVFSTNRRRGFIAKINPNGVFCWAKLYDVTSATGVGEIISIKHNSIENELYFTGAFSGTNNFGSTYTFTANGTDIVVGVIDTSGNTLNAVKMGGNGTDVGKDIVVDSLGNYYITGNFRLTGNFGTGATPRFLSATGIGMNGFLVKLNSQLQDLWVSSIQSGTDVNVSGLGLYNQSHIYLAGYFQGNLAVGTATFNSAGNNDIFWSSFDINGAHAGTVKKGGTGNDRLNKIFCAKNSFIITGVFNGTLDLGGLSITSQGHNHYIAEYGYNSILQWGDNFQGSGTEEAYSVLTDEEGNYYTSGYFDNTTNFSGLTGSFSITPLMTASFVHKKKPCSIPLPKPIHTIIHGVSRDTIDMCYGNLKLYFNDIPNVKQDTVGNASLLVNADSSVTLNAPIMNYIPESGNVANGSRMIWIENPNCPGPRKGYYIRRKRIVKYVEYIRSDCPGNTIVKLHLEDSSKTHTFVWTNNNGPVVVPHLTSSTGTGLHGSYTVDVFSEGCQISIVLDAFASNNNATITSGHVFKTTNGNSLEYYWPQTTSNLQWVNCSNYAPITGATAYQFTPTASGDYALILTNTTNGITCSDTSECFNITITNIEKAQVLQASVYPNPANSELLISSEGNCVYEVFSIDGKVLFAGQFTDKTLLNIQTLPQGLYVVHVKDNQNKVAHIKFVKE